MSNNIFWIFELKIKEGKLESLKNLMSEMVNGTEKNEPDTIAYEWTFRADNKICHIHERYADSEAAVKHLRIFLEKYAARLLETGDADRFVVYGNPTAQLKEILDDFAPEYMTVMDGFIR